MTTHLIKIEAFTYASRVTKLSMTTHVNRVTKISMTVNVLNCLITRWSPSIYMSLKCSLYAPDIR